MLNTLLYTVEDQAESQANGEESEIHMTPPQKVDQPSAIMQQLKLAEVNAKQPDEPAKQPDESAKQPDEPDKQATCTSVSAEQPSIQNLPKRSPTISAPHCGTQTNRKKLMKIIIPTKPIYTRKLPNFKVCACPCCVCMVTCVIVHCPITCHVCMDYKVSYKRGTRACRIYSYSYRMCT